MKKLRFRKHLAYEDGTVKKYEFNYNLEIGDIFKLTVKCDGDIDVCTYLVVDRQVSDVDPLSFSRFEPPAPVYSLLRLDTESIFATPLAKNRNAFYELLAQSSLMCYILCMENNMKPQIGDVWYNESLSIHALIMDLDPDQRMAKQGWRLTLILEANEYNWFVTDDFPQYHWKKVA